MFVAPGPRRLETADRKLMTPEMIARLATQFHLPEERTEMHVSRCMQTNARTYMLTIVIGDIHGMAAKLENLLVRIRHVVCGQRKGRATPIDLSRRLY